VSFVIQRKPKTRIKILSTESLEVSDAGTIRTSWKRLRPIPLERLVMNELNTFEVKLKKTITVSTTSLSKVWSYDLESRRDYGVRIVKVGVKGRGGLETSPPLALGKSGLEVYFRLELENTSPVTLAYFYLRPSETDITQEKELSRVILLGAKGSLTVYARKVPIVGSPDATISMLKFRVTEMRVVFPISYV